MHPLYSVAELRAAERAALDELPPGTLMQRAGQAAAKAALELLPLPPGHAKVLVLAGPGDNGGDALEVACRLAQEGVQVSALQWVGQGQASADAQAAEARARAALVHFEDPAELSEGSSRLTSTRWTLVVDGLFGIGLKRPLSGDLRTLVETVNGFPCPVLALDVPSGLDADSGEIVGPHGVALRATHTITFIGDKPGLHTAFGRDHAGQVRVARLEVEQRHLPQPHAHLNQPELFARALQRRPHNSHKGSFGTVSVLGGAAGMAGAVLLAARAAAHCGAGKVLALFAGPAPALDGNQPELMCRAAQGFDCAGHTLVLGPGLGATPAALELLAETISLSKGSAAGLVLDADALNLLAGEPGLRALVRQRKGRTILTPHPLEAARLLGSDAKAVQADRLGAARHLAREFQAVVILKGSGSVIAGQHGNVVLNPTGSAALACAGSGDVLAGACGALLAQHWPEWEAALAATWLHGDAADTLVAQGHGPIGLTAGELVPAMRQGLNALVERHAPRWGVPG